MKLRDATVGTRLAIGYSFTLLMLCLIVGLAVWGLHETRKSVEFMVDQTMLKERLVAEWAAGTNLNGARVMLVAESTDAHRREEVQARIKETTARISAIQKQLEGFEHTPEETRLFEQIAQQRKNYIATREEVFREKAVSEDNARALVRARLEPVLAEYVNAIGKLATAQSEKLAHTRAEVERLALQSMQWLTALGALAVLASVGVAFLIARSIRRQLGGEPAEAADIALRIAEGDLAVRVPSAAEGSLMAAMGRMRQGLTRLVGEVRHGSEVIAMASQEIASGNVDLSARTEEQASALEQTASSMEELTSTVKHNAHSARQAQQLATAATAIAGEGGAVVSQVVETMGAIHASSRRIVDIIGIIDGIAFQTNILALNAAVEAARAGEQGRGFAVVASEVRGLAQRSAAAAKDIQALIEESVRNVENGSKLVDQAGATIARVVESVKHVNDLISEIAAAGDQQRSGIEQVNQAIAQMDEMTQQNAALVEQAAASADALQQQARELAQMVSAFRLENGAATNGPAPSAQAAPQLPHEAPREAS